MINKIETKRGVIECRHNDKMLKLKFKDGTIAIDWHTKEGVAMLDAEATLDLITMLTAHYEEIKSRYITEYDSYGR